MKRASAAAVARGLERLVDPGTVAGLTERQVLARFVEQGDPVAFEATVVRHGPMVLSVCRQLLRDANDVDDAFQATFVILIEKAGSLKQPDRLGPWLYGVARRVASRLRRRRRTESLPPDLQRRSADHDPAEVDQLSALHDEIQRLPEKYRLPILLCCVGEESYDDAARKLGWPVGTVHGRLSRGRDLLRGRLGRRGIAIPEVISRPAARTSSRRETPVPEPLLRSTLALLSGPVPTQLQTIARGVHAAMFIQKLRSTGLVVAMTTLGVASAATAVMAFQQPKKQSGLSATNESSQQPNPEKTKAAYGKAILPASHPEVDDAEGEHVAIELEKMKAQLEMLELKSETLRNRIQEGTKLVDQLEDSSQQDLTNDTPGQAEKYRKSLEKQRDSKRLYIQTWEEQYLKTRIEIARLNYRIARAPRPLAEAERDDSARSLSDLVRRIDRVEAKVDRIAESLRRGQGR
jgi:RNA polymerase sigma factor (sigma-70 family)